MIPCAAYVAHGDGRFFVIAHAERGLCHLSPYTVSRDAEGLLRHFPRVAGTHVDRGVVQHHGAERLAKIIEAHGVPELALHDGGRVLFRKGPDIVGINVAVAVNVPDVEALRLEKPQADAEVRRAARVGRVVHIAAIATEDRPEVWGGEKFEDADLVEVVWDEDAEDWREVE